MRFPIIRSRKKSTSINLNPCRHPFRSRLPDVTLTLIVGRMILFPHSSAQVFFLIERRMNSISPKTLSGASYQQNPAYDALTKNHGRMNAMGRLVGRPCLKPCVCGDFLGTMLIWGTCCSDILTINSSRPIVSYTQMRFNLV